MSQLAKISNIFGGIFLIIMALFHGSGYSYISEMIHSSNTEDFLKDIVPTLFIHPSIHLLGLAAFGFLAFFLGPASKKVLVTIAILVFIDALLGFFIGGIVPGLLLSLAAFCFLFAGLSK
ncbi:hypothetical protein [Spongiivirga citrea]|uniref:DUF4064 domain-containing protein n=1 Tax=Spongiivirga citrea TaxID=1481457 RepID=A0A6M0CRS5_9FLAO|nr:hypothetical protein [Spongiivirga citrea]NER18794.1 hypothetical protein [Spongiivirga citrea]